MQIKYIVGIAVITAVLTTLVVLPRLAKSSTPDVITVYEKQATLSSAQIIWLARLMQCESGIKAKAVNPKDLDGTPSLGILQFKPSTYIAAAKQIGLASTTDYMNPEGQVSIVTQWILKGGVIWKYQFPDCVRVLGIPPSTNNLD